MELRVAVESSNLVEVETVETIPPDHPNIELYQNQQMDSRQNLLHQELKFLLLWKTNSFILEVVNSEVVSEFFIAPETKVFAKVFDKVSVSILSK